MSHMWMKLRDRVSSLLLAARSILASNCGVNVSGRRSHSLFGNLCRQIAYSLPRVCEM